MRPIILTDNIPQAHPMFYDIWSEVYQEEGYQCKSSIEVMIDANKIVSFRIWSYTSPLKTYSIPFALITQLDDLIIALLRDYANSKPNFTSF